MSEPLTAAGALRDARKRAGMTLRDASRFVEVHFSYLSKVENGHEHPSDALVMRMCRAYAIDPEPMLLERAIAAVPEPVRAAIAAIAATEAPGRVAALDAALRAIAAREPAPAIPGCTCDPDSATDDDGNLVMCDLHEPMLRHLRWETLASLVIDYQAFMRHALAVADAALAALAAPASPAGVSGEVCLGCGEPEEPRRIPCCSNCSCPIPFAPTPTPSEPVGRCAVCGDGPDEGVHKGQTSGSAFHAYWPDPFTPATRDE